jgi:hypothetical protein
MARTKTRQIFWTKLGICLAFVWASLVSSRPALAFDPDSVLASILCTITGDEGFCCDCACESWVVDATCVPSCGDLSSGIRCLRFWKVARGGYRREYSLDGFIAAMSPSVPTMFYVHGYGLSESGAALGTSRLACYFRPCVDQPFRSVTWVWDARHQFLSLPINNIMEKSQKAEAQGFYLAHTLRQLPPEMPIALVGHSFGCRSVCSCLQGLATSQVCQNYLPAEGLDALRRIEATLIAPGLESDGLGPNGRYPCALTQVERMNMTYNPGDRVLRTLAFFTGDSNVMGLTGPWTCGWSLEQQSKVYVSNVSDNVFRAHRIGRYTRNPSSRPALLPRLLSRE